MSAEQTGPAPELPRIQLKYPNLEAFAKAARKTFKLGRMTLKSKKELCEGNRVGLCVSVPERDQPIEIIGEVIDVVTGAQGQVCTYGIRFLNFSEKKLSRLLELAQVASQAEVVSSLPATTPVESEPSAPAEPSAVPDTPPPPPAPEPTETKSTPPATSPTALNDEETEVYTIEMDHSRKTPSFDGREEKAAPIPMEQPPAPVPASAPLEPDEDSGTIELPADEAEPASSRSSFSPTPSDFIPLPQADEVSLPKPAEKVPGPEQRPVKESQISALPEEKSAVPAAEAVPPVPATVVAVEEQKELSAAGEVEEEVTVPEGREELKPLTPAGYEALGAFLLRLTRQCLGTGKTVPAKNLWEEFRGVLEGRDELSIFLNLGPTGKEFWLEGTGFTPVALKNVLPRELTADLVTKLAELFERKKILGLTLRRYLAEEAFAEALRRFSAYVPEVMRPEDLAGDLLGAKAFGFILIFAADRPAGAEALSWRPALFLTRLSGELKRLGWYARALSEDPRSVLTLRVEEALKPMRDPAWLAEILLHCELAVFGQEEFSEADLQSEIVFALPLEFLVRTVERLASLFEEAFIAKQKAPSEPGVVRREEKLRKTLRRSVARVAYESAESGMKILGRLYRKGVLSYEELPEALRDRVDAERSADEFMVHLPDRLAQLEAAKEPEDYRRQARQLLNILIEFVRRGRMDLAEQIFKVMVAHRTEKTPPFPSRPGLAKEAMGVFGEPASLEILVKAFQSDQKEVRERVASLLYAAGEPAVPVLLDVLAESTERSVRKLACDVLTRLGGKVAPLLKARIFRSDTAWYLARNLIMVLGDMKSNELVAEIEPFLSHEHPRVREESLSYLTKVEGVDPEPRLVRALQDPEPSVRRRAIQLLGNLPEVAEAAIQGVVLVLEQKGGVPPKKEEEMLFLQALEFLSRKKPAKVPDGRSLQTVLVGLWEMESQGLLKRLSGAKPVCTPRMRAALVEAMGRVGGEKCKKALKEAAKDKDELVRKAAQAALRSG